MTIPLLATEWYCPSCGKRDHAPVPPTGHRMHTCPALRFLMAPMLPAGTAAKVELREREDYIGREIVQLDPERGRPVQSLTVTRDNGQDAIVYAPTAQARGD